MRAALANSVRSGLLALMFVGFLSTMTAFFVLMLGFRSSHSRTWPTSLVLLLNSLLILAALACVYKVPSARGVVPAKIHEEGKFIWASCAFDMLHMPQHSLEFRNIQMRRGQAAAEWTRSPPLSMVAQVQALPQKTCLCCLDDFLPSSQVAILPCGHVYHEDCVASWSFSTAAAAGSCPSCRLRYNVPVSC